MSCKVLVIPEDPTLNGYLLKPLVEKVMEDAGKRQAKVLVLRDPKVGGFSQAVDLITSGKLRDKYGHYDFWLFLPDGDMAKDLREMEQKVVGQKARLITCAIQPEVEILVLAGHPKADVRPWAVAIKHPKFKETYFAPFLREHGDRRAPGQGREQLMREALRQYARIKRLCPEIAELEKRITGL